jgi:uncharacterized protein YyaL (SSP411 family)
MKFILKKYSFLSLFFALIVLLSACSQAQEHTNKKHKYTNELINETSPYLLQHAHNPVNWHAWNEKTRQKAKKEGKLMLISIGYAACHWCHVMEKESFEDSTVAKFMNEHFIAVKVDREERPDVDQIYMEACQLTNGRGGWPLNAVTLPDGRPIYAGTYFPKEEWLRMLKHFQENYETNPEGFDEQATRVLAGINQNEFIFKKEDKKKINIAELDLVFDNWQDKIDFKKGGRQGSPKFPMPNNYEFLLRYFHLSKNQKAKEAVLTTLNNMAWGGIYDQIGGGFARYSTDANWKAPHFEKMLYDNGQLVSLYSMAFQLTKNPFYKDIVYQSLDFIERELTSPEGAFYSSLDADSEGEEGKYYVWKKTEIDEVLGQESELFCDYYQVSQGGNWEHKNNILFRARDKNNTFYAKKYSISEKELQSQLESSKKKLFTVRNKRIHPNLDDKVLCTWNALMLKGYADAYRAFGEKKFLDVAIKNADFIINKMADGNRLHRNYKNGKATINGFLSDYSFTIEAFITLYQVTFDEKWLYKAKDLNEYVLEHFYDNNSGMFYYASDIDFDLISRKMKLGDNVIPSPNSSMAKNLFVFGQYFDNKDYLDKSRQMLSNIQENILNNGSYYSNWGILMTYFASSPYEVAIVGDDFEAKRKEWEQNFAPNVFLLGGKNEGTLSLLKNKLIQDETMIYVCQEKTCQFPVKEVKKAIKQMEK